MNNISQVELANYLQIDKSTVCKWEKGTREPSLDVIGILSIFLDVPTDFLFGLSDEYGNSLNQVPHLKVAAREKPKSK